MTPLLRGGQGRTEDDMHSAERDIVFFVGLFLAAIAGLWLFAEVCQ